MKNKVSKIVAVLLTCCMILSLVACGSKEKTTNGGNSESNQSVSEDSFDLTQNDDEDKKEDEEIAVGNEDADESSQSENKHTSSENKTNKNTTNTGDSQKGDKIPVNKEDNIEVAPEENENVSGVVVPKGEYREGIVLVKFKNSFDETAFGEIQYTSAEALYSGSKWYSVKLTDVNTTKEAVTYLSNLETFESVDYDYVMGVTAKESENPNYNQQTNLGLHNIPYGWTQNGKHPGGSPDAVVAIIDTGIDYNHLDLRNNVWVNSAEIPDNGKDDDGNGYIDDVYGWDCVGNDNDPMDDNGHGTHVAGIVAAENNKVGGIGVAYNCKVMALKAGNSSGYFNNSDIAEAVQYAYMNGASVINMSFGGSFISIAVEEALENAYNACVLVAAAGNDSACNNLACKTCDFVKVSYPAALPYVIGVMSTDKNGDCVSSFSNYDHNPYDSIEYEVYAVGEGVGSTWPSNEYACLNGTSMASPSVAGIAALLRSYYADREMYSTKFIQSQIVNTGTVNPYNVLLEESDDAHSVADVQEAMTKLPKPAVNLYSYTIDDSVSINKNNNGNGVIDAGETVRLRIALHNRGGVASDVNVSIDTDRGMGLADPYFTFTNPTMSLSDIGTYSVRESGEDKYFEIIVSADCPNDYLVDFNIRFTYTNGLDSKDKTVYTDDGRQQAQFNVSSGYHLPSVISEDTVFTNDRLYIVSENVMITAGATVTFEEGCRIQYYDDSEYYNSPKITVYGTLNISGTQEQMVSMYPSERYPTFVCGISNHGVLNIDYIDSINLQICDEISVATSIITNSNCKVDSHKSGYHVYKYYNGLIDSCNLSWTNIDNCENSYIEITAYGQEIGIQEMLGNYIVIYTGNYNDINCTRNFSNNILYSDYAREVGARELNFGGIVANNIFAASNDEDPLTLMWLGFAKKDLVLNNTFSAGYQKYANQIITNYLNENGQPTVDVFGSCGDVSMLYPHIVKVEIFNKDGEQITTIGKEEITVRVTFNKAMDTTKDVNAFFGTIAPYADYKIEGTFVSDTVWEGTYSLKAYIENGLQFMNVKGACVADDATKTVRGENQMYVFNIDTTAAMAMSLFATATDSGIELTWVQDDYDTLMGYNIYRATSKDGKYVKINPSVILAGDSSFVDTNAEPGVTYWYTFTVVLSDFSESAPAGKVFCTAVDTLNPSIYHTPVNQGYQNNNLVISCTASDNMRDDKVILYYRTTGTSEWKTITMSKVNDRYSATVFGSELAMEGLEYYIVASDGTNSISKGTATEPYLVVIKDASVISRIGDVDGDGTVTTKDALMIMQCINGDLIMTDDEFRRADLNGDEELSSVEALRILQYINGNVSTLDM